jgi:signal transduction histidine kinase
VTNYWGNGIRSRLFLRLLAVAAVETAVMFGIEEFFPRVGPLAHGLLDVVVLVATLVPLAYFWIGGELRRLEAAETRLQHDYELQAALADILKIAMEDLPLGSVLERVLDRIFAVSWLAIEAKGGVFLADEEPEVLVLKAQRGFGKPILAACSRVPFGRCLCGRAAASGETVFASHADERHETAYEGMPEHGHYCLPIKRGGKLLGVLVLYVKAGYARKSREEDFLTAVADTLSGIIAHDRMLKVLLDREMRLHGAQKQEAFAQVSAGVFHELKNPLGVILGFAQSALRHVRQEDASTLPLKSIEREALRCRDLVQNLGAFSGEEIPTFEDCNFDKAVEGALESLQGRAHSKGVELEQELVCASRVHGNAGQLQQIVLNLGGNALDAMPKGGRLRVSTRRVQEGGREWARLDVSDTGIGIPRKLREKIFEPFFTTKGPGRGLGLALVAEVVRKHGGRVELQSEEGRGTAFSVFFPIR